MKKRGFTLVELLAVIVILAIIALIAVPIVIHIINDSKTSSEKESLNLYTDTVEKAITKKQMSEPNFNPDICEIKDKGNLECFKGTTSLGIVEIEMKGQVPESGTVIIEGNNIKYENIVLNEKTYYEKESFVSYSIGDKIIYKGADWYVIENSPSKQDYVILLKEITLNSNEIGNNYVYSFECDGAHAYGLHDCNSSEIGQTINTNKTAYYWSVSCHNSGTYGNDTYESNDTTGCDGHNDYVGSKIKQAVEAYMDTYLDPAELKEVNNYKIRLITYDELSTNFGWTGGPATSAGAPTWMYNADYWIMKSDDYSGSDAWYVSSDGYLNGGGRVNLSRGVRPVINLLKSAIPDQQ